jgi:aspartate/methionine/tyrosine aminotransferase
VSAAQSILRDYPFGRLSKLLDGYAPGRHGIDLPEVAGGKPILLSVGEPQNAPPAFIAEEIAKVAADFCRYPPPRGTPAYLEACAAWLTRRYGLPPGMIDPKTMILAIPGSREGLFFAALAAMPEVAPGAPRPAILMPNPCYHVYPGAAIAIGAEPVFVPVNAAGGHLPDYGALPEAVLANTALAFYCTPANPQGAAADEAEMKRQLTLARTHGYTLAVDECYAEIYTDTPPAGALQAAAALGSSLDNLLAFHSLSKRSSAPGLRCGFAVGAPDLIATLEVMLRTGGAGVAHHVLAAGNRLWREEAHVTENRARYRKNFEIAERVLGNRFGFRKPDGGFFLWLEVGDGENAALTLWREAGIRVLPGGYMARADANGVNPGDPYVRIALVYGPELTEAALNRLTEVL